MRRIERQAQAEPEQAERRQPLYRNARRAFQILRAEIVAHRAYAVRSIEFKGFAGREDIADVIEQADPGRATPFCRHGQYELVSVHDPHIAAVGVPELILRPQPALAIATDGVRAAAEEIAVRGKLFRSAEVLAKVHREIRRQRHRTMDRKVSEEVVVPDPVMDIAARSGG